MGISKKEEQEYAQILYTKERLTAKEIAVRTNVTEKTIGKWIIQFGWDKMRKSLLTTKQNQLIHWYNQLEAINEDIANRPDLLIKGKRETNPYQKNIPTNGEADTMSKITSNIQRLEVETNIGEYVQVSTQLLTFIQGIDLDEAIRFKNYVDEFINGKLKNG